MADARSPPGGRQSGRVDFAYGPYAGAIRPRPTGRLGENGAAISESDFGPSDLSTRGLSIPIATIEKVSNHATIKPNTRRRSLWRTVLLAIVAIAVGGAGTVAALAYFNVIDPAKLAFWRSKEADHKGMIPVPVAARSINAFTEITGYDLTDPKTGELTTVYMLPREIPKGTILDSRRFAGESRRMPWGPCSISRKMLFCPRALIRALWQARRKENCEITLDAGKINGVHDLKMGDHFDLFVSVPVDMPGAGRSSAGSRE